VTRYLLSAEVFGAAETDPGMSVRWVTANDSVSSWLLLSSYPRIRPGAFGTDDPEDLLE
jgi:hypothetical protein